jgi:hypothetical protein
MSASTRTRARVASQQQIAAMLATIRKQESELDNVKDFSLKLAARVLRLELAVSALDKDDSLRAILYPDNRKA